MSARRHINPDQLRMFIPAGELADPAKYEHYDVKHNVREGFGQVKDRKIREAKQPGWRIGKGPRIPSLRDSIKAEGIQQPVGVYVPPPASALDANPKPMLGNGHHRVFTANDLDPKTEVPVIWRD